jgi:hypothetical protein
MAVLGVDNDPNLCTAIRRCRASTSTRPASAEAPLLDTLMAGAAAPMNRTCWAPRGSPPALTDLWVEDEEAAATIRYIREHAAKGSWRRRAQPNVRLARMR